MPLHADIQVRARNVGLDCLTPILWHKIANGATEVEGNGAGFYGKPYQPGGPPLWIGAAYPEAIRLFAESRLHVDGQRVLVRGK